MVRVSPPSLSAASGELSELMFARRDFARHQNGLRAARGFVILPEGPATRLPGTEFMGFTAGDAPARLMAFVFRDEDAVLLEWTDSLLRFWRTGQLVMSGASPYTLATPYDAAQAARLQSLQSADRIYLTDGSLPPHRLSRFGLTSWTIEPTPFTGGPFAPRNLNEALEIGVSAVTGTISLTASGPVFAAHHVGTLFQLLEIDTSDTPYWTADVDAFIGDRAYYNGRCYQIVAFDDQQGYTGTVRPAVTAGTPPLIANDNQVTWAWVAAGNTGGYPAWSASAVLKLGARRYLPAPDDMTIEVSGFTANPAGGTRKTGINPPVHLEGRWLSEKGGCVWQALHDGAGIVRITAVADAQNATGVVEKRLPDGLVTSPTYRWAEQAWSDSRGWPRAIGGFEQRHIYGGTPTEPRTIWTTVIGGTTDMTTGAKDDDGFSYILPPQPRKIGEIRAILSTSDALVISTSADQQIGRATDIDRAFARETARFSADDTTGAADVFPLMIEGQAIFVEKGGMRLMALAPDPSGRFHAENLTMISRHILGPGCTRIVRQDAPLPVIWGLLADGELMGLTYAPSQQVVGFHRHNLGGVIEDIEVLPADDGVGQDLWLVVRRSIAGVTRRCVERMKPPFVDLDGRPAVLADAWHQMCARRWQGSPSTTIPGLSHLNGQAVTAWTELGAFTGLVVVGGSVTLPRAVTSAIVGLDVTDLQRLDTLDIVTGQPDGGDDGRHRTHRRTALRVHRSAGGTLQIIGATDGKPVPAENQSPAKPIFPWNSFQTPELRNGTVEIGGLKGWDHDLFLRLRPTPGAPLTVTARTPTIMITDD